MSHKRTQPVARATYVGLQRYFVTMGTLHRTPTLDDDPVIEDVLRQLRQRAANHRFAIHAYCFMPDRVDVVLEGLSESSDLRRFLRDWKRQTTLDYQESTGGDLWQRGYFDHLVRADEDMGVLTRYVLAGPVRAGLVADGQEYRYSGAGG